MKATIVVPTIREECIESFLRAWEPEFRDHRVIVVEDNPKRSFSLPAWLEHYSWEQIEGHLEEKAWIIPRRSGAIRNYGMLLAAGGKSDMIVLLDDDCLPDQQPFLERHWQYLETPGTKLPIFNTMFAARADSVVGYVRPRGYPKERSACRTVLNHGLWVGTPDLDGETQKKQINVNRWGFDAHSIQIPPGVQFPMSAMNVAFRPELLPAMYQLPMGAAQPFHRFDDIWCGLIMKKACNAMGWSVRSGSPFVHHARASDAKRNAELEAPGIIENEIIWRAVQDIGDLGYKVSLGGALMAIHTQLLNASPSLAYWKFAATAAATWRGLIAQQQER